MQITYKERKQNPLYVRISSGNRKLKPNADTKYIIFNLPAMVTCPYATANCINSCYARKAERCYPNALNARYRNYYVSHDSDFTERMIYTIETELLRPSYITANRVIVRIHESGDFYSQAYTDAWLAVARHFKRVKKVKFMAYTKSLPYFKNRTIPENMIIRSSIWDDTTAEMIRLTEEMHLPIYTAVPKFTTETKSEKCLCINCSTCNKCWNRKQGVIKCEIH